ncbi:uncharacterized protein A1O9_09965 [Exophiala aquamarina CBS 119918]|uniref:Major facilitator superfamily (MFS) profile domain-containing protein n=1 Tax=Exophiala aquamarina CBS 119918 TaxID=1182545 RepID=A0A072PF20_9EURO|nr:uncharacterized protein A1O9_09965 [Exophiala aquamarina CBS 119918]KEF54170.1 hypothetical protein A1O9_09965 [Exophiala aquamarina CBS 119918]
MVQGGDALEAAAEAGTERTALRRSEAQDIAEATPTWPERLLIIPRNLWLPALIFMLGSAADFCEGSFFATGFTDIGSSFKAQEDAAWLKIGYATLMAIAQPSYSLACNKWSWHGPILLSYVLFSAGLVLWSVQPVFGIPRDATSLTVNSSCSSRSPNLMTLIFARLLTAGGSAGMVYVPSLVFNVPEVLSCSDRPRWTSIQHAFAALGQFIGSQLAESNLRNDSILKKLLFRQGLVVSILAGIIAIWMISQRDIRPDMRIMPLTSGGRLEQRSGPPSFGASAMVGMVLLAVPIVAFCFAFGWVMEESRYHVLWSPLLLVGISSSAVFWLHQSLVSSDASLLPQDLPTLKRDDILWVFAAVFFKDGASSVFLFLIPWISQNSGLSRKYTFRSYWFLVPFGAAITAFWIKKSSKTKSPLLLGAILCSSAVGILSIFVYLTCIDIGIPLALYPLSGIFGIGNGMVESALLPRLLVALEEHMRHQAVVYAAFHLISTFADSLWTALSNTMFLWSASEFMRRSLSNLVEEGMVEKIIKECRHDNQCTNGLAANIKHAVHIAYLRASVAVCFVAFLGSLCSVLIVWYWITDVALEESNGEIDEH